MLSTKSRPLGQRPQGLKKRGKVWAWEPTTRAQRDAKMRGFTIVGEDGKPVPLSDMWLAYRIAQRHNDQLASCATPTTTTATASARGADRSLPTLIAIFKASSAYTTTEKGKPRAERSIADFKKLCRYLLGVAYLTDTPVTAYEKPALQDVFVTLQQERGETVGFQMFQMLRTLLFYAVDLGWIEANPCSRLKRVLIPEGRKDIVYTVDEIVAFIRAAEHVGLECMVDAFVLALTTAQEVGDIMAMPLLVEEAGEGFFGPYQRLKTGEVYFTPLMPLLLTRIKGMNARNAQRFGHHRTITTQLVSSQNGRPYVYCKFNPAFCAVRALAAGDIEKYNSYRQKEHTAFLPLVSSLAALGERFKPTPSILDKTFNDARGTVLSRIVDVAGIAVSALVGGHALGRDMVGATAKQNAKVFSKHYWKRVGSSVATSDAHHAWDDLYDVLHPKPTLAKTG